MPQRSILSLETVMRRFGDVVALNGVSLDIAEGEIVCLVGQSGCGKSTLLRTIAGVEPLDGGRVHLNGALVSGDGTFVEPEHRQIGYMFQDYALFPHLSVRQNVGFGLRRLARGERPGRISEVIERIGIAHLADRFPHMLSGGEQQRVALARALAPQPHVLLMDEPFSNLDRGLRETVRRETLALVRELGITAIVVTHDPEEALAIGDRVALMQNGRILEIGTAEAIYRRPSSAYAAGFFSAVNRIPGQRKGATIETALGQFPAPPGQEPVEAFVRPHAIRIAETGIAARVESRVALGEIEEMVIFIAGYEAPITVRGVARHNVAPGAYVAITVDAEDVMVFPAKP